MVLTQGLPSGSSFVNYIGKPQNKLNRLEEMEDEHE
jgi:hypothetical protein